LIKKIAEIGKPKVFRAARGAAAKQVVICLLLTYVEGPPKKIDGPPRAFAKFQTHPPTTRLFPPCFFLKVRFGRFSARGVQKHHTNIFTKSPCRNLFPKKTTKISMSVFLSFSCFFPFLGVSQRWDSKALQKAFYKFYEKNRVEKFLQKNRPKIQNWRFASRFCYQVFGRFSASGVQKHDEKCHQKKVPWP
jgi:hypothetical protein